MQDASKNVNVPEVKEGYDSGEFIGSEIEFIPNEIGDDGIFVDEENVKNNPSNKNDYPATVEDNVSEQDSEMETSMEVDAEEESSDLSSIDSWNSDEEEEEKNEKMIFAIAIIAGLFFVFIIWKFMIRNENKAEKDKEDMYSKSNIIITNKEEEYVEKNDVDKKETQKAMQSGIQKQTINTQEDDVLKSVEIQKQTINIKKKHADNKGIHTKIAKEEEGVEKEEEKKENINDKTQEESTVKFIDEYGNEQFFTYHEESKAWDHQQLVAPKNQGRIEEGKDFTDCFNKGLTLRFEPSIGYIEWYYEKGDGKKYLQSVVVPEDQRTAVMKKMKGFQSEEIIGFVPHILKNIEVTEQFKMHNINPQKRAKKKSCDLKKHEIFTVIAIEHDKIQINSKVHCQFDGWIERNDYDKIQNTSKDFSWKEEQCCTGKNGFGWWFRVYMLVTFIIGIIEVFNYHYHYDHPGKWLFHTKQAMRIAFIAYAVLTLLIYVLYCCKYVCNGDEKCLSCCETNAMWEPTIQKGLVTGISGSLMGIPVIIYAAAKSGGGPGSADCLMLGIIACLASAVFFSALFILSIPIFGCTNYVCPLLECSQNKQY